MLYGSNQGITPNPTVTTARNLQVNPGSYNVVLGGYTFDYTAMNGAIVLNGSAQFTAANSGRTDFTGPISGSGAVLVGNSGYIEGDATTTGILLSRNLQGNTIPNGTVVFAGSDTYSGATNITSGSYVNGSLANSTRLMSRTWAIPARQRWAEWARLPVPLPFGTAASSRAARTARASSPSATR